MGGKRTGTGKQIYFCLAGLILFSLAGCAILKTFQEREEARDSLVRARGLFAQGDYEASLKENQRVLSLSANRSPADEALFQMGLIYAHAENPKRDQRRAVALFQRVIDEHSQSPLAEQARVWVGVLQMNERLSRINEKLNQANEKLSQMIEKSKQVDIEIEGMKRGKER